MKPKKPDRFEREIMKQVNHGESFDPFIHYDDVIKLLRKEHKAVMRMVKKHYFPQAEHGSVNYGYNQAVDFILDQLTRRAR